MKKLSALVVLLVAALTNSGCLCFPRNKEPDPSSRIGGPSTAKAFKEEPKRGFQVKLVVTPPGSKANKNMSGELLAIDPKHVWIQTTGKRYRIPREKIIEMVIVGLSATGDPAPSKQLKVDLNYLDYTAKYARHPQGMPQDAAPLPRIEPEPAPEPKSPPEPEPPPEKAAVPPAPKPDPEKSGGFVLEGTRLLWGMGAVNDIRDPILARKLADARARKQIAVLIQHHLRLEGPLDLVLQHIEIADRWQVPEENAHYSIAVMELDKCGLTPDLAEKLWERVLQEGTAQPDQSRP